MLKEFAVLLTGDFDNRTQYEEMKKNGRDDFPFARHKNTVCNDRISGLPEDFNGVFLLEESYYTTKGPEHASPHLFLLKEEGEKIVLHSYDVPEGFDKNTFSAETFTGAPYDALHESAKFTPAVYEKKGDVWEGGSVSMFTPVLKFTLYERFSEACLEVTEHMEVNGKRTFGYDEPIRYERCPAEKG